MPRPSDARRQRLNNELSLPTVSNFFPLDNYYKIADTVYAGFQETYATTASLQHKALSDALDDSYVFGKRYCIFLMNGLTKHNYYGTPKFKSQQAKHNRQMQAVVDQLEKVVDRMDTIEAAWQAAAAERAEQEELLRFAALQDRVKDLKRSGTSRKSLNGDDVAASALEKLQLLNSGQAMSDRTIRRDPSGEEPLGPASTRYAMEDNSDEEAVTPLPPPVVPLPPPVLPQQGPAAPPSYHQALESRRNGNNYWGPSTASSTATTATSSNGDRHTAQAAAEAPRKKKKKKIPLKQQQEQDERLYREFKRAGKIQTHALSTYQGRIGASTNGCTVISALVASHHLRTGNVHNQEIANVIDRQCGPILREIRSKLGLGDHALIIPSDVHDHLVDRKLLPQDKFLGVAGGSVLDTEHLNEFIKLLAMAPNTAAATLFFKEHVVSLVKYNSGRGHYCYDLIDSLPGPKGTASRTSCEGLEALTILVRWYTSHKFSSGDCRHVDKTDWNDMLADVDPRVFQGFVWGEQPDSGSA